MLPVYGVHEGTCSVLDNLDTVSFSSLRQTEDPHHLKVNISTLANRDFASRRHFHRATVPPELASELGPYKPVDARVSLATSILISCLTILFKKKYNWYMVSDNTSSKKIRTPNKYELVYARGAPPATAHYRAHRVFPAPGSPGDVPGAKAAPPTMRAAFVLAAAASDPSDLWQSAVPVAVPGSHEECRWVEILHYVSTGGAPYRQCVRQGAALLSQILVREGRWPDCDVLARLWNETSQDGVFVDAGANIGSCSLMMLSPGLRRNHMSKAPRRRDSAQASARQRSRSSRCPSTISTSRRACSPIRGCASD